MTLPPPPTPPHTQPSELGELEELTELWLDSNCLYELPEVRIMYVHYMQLLLGQALASLTLVI